MLPIEEIRQPLRTALKSGLRRFVLEAPTGSGKSTQVPQMLVDEGLVAPNQMVVVLQPRRLAARLLARRVAQERNGKLGDEVGYQVRFDNISGPRTRIKFVTEALLLRQILEQPNLPGIGAILLDEFHERHLHGDLSLALAMRTQQTCRPDLILGVMSATLQAGPLETYLSPCARLRSGGRTHPVEIAYSKDARAVAGLPIWTQAAHHVAKLIAERPEGDVLVFMPGAYEISRTLGALREQGVERFADLRPLHGELPPDQQDAALDPGPRRKVIISTNVAETSLTIEGVRMVVDAGLARVPAYDPQRHLNTLLTQKISRASSDQRAGRAGRTAPGYALRLWGENEHWQRPEVETPEIGRLDLSETLLTLRAADLDPAALPWFEPPTPKALERAAEFLHDLGALDATGHATEDGRSMARFPLEPRFSRLLLAAARNGCVAFATKAAAVAQGRSLLLPLSDERRAEDRETKLERPGEAGLSDLFPEIRALELAEQERFDWGWCQTWGIHQQAALQASKAAVQFLRLAKSQGLPTDDPASDPATALRRSILAAFGDRVGLRMDRATLRCQLVHNRRGDLRKTCVTRKADLIVAAELEERETPHGVDLLLGMTTAIEPAWLAETFPDDVRVTSKMLLHQELRKVVNVRERWFRDLLLESKISGEPDAETAARFLVEEIVEERLQLKNWDGSVTRWIARVNLLAKVCPEHGFPAIGPDELRLIYEQLCHGKTTLKEVRESDPWPILGMFLNDFQNNELDRLAPEHWTLPNGRRSRLRYEDDGTVVLSATVQHLYDSPAKPAIADGRCALLVEILAPNQRPVQVTSDLGRFWESAYHEVKKQLKGRYPRHEWR